MELVKLPGGTAGSAVCLSRPVGEGPQAGSVAGHLEDLDVGLRAVAVAHEVVARPRLAEVADDPRDRQVRKASRLLSSGDCQSPLYADCDVFVLALSVFGRGRAGGEKRPADLGSEWEARESHDMDVAHRRPRVAGAARNDRKGGPVDGPSIA
jgi:hypothetical protein